MTTLNETAAAIDRRRRKLLGLGLTAFGAAIMGSAMPAVSLVGQAEAAAAAAAQKIADHFSSVQTMSGEFVQFGPRGEQTGGKFFIQRPGKIRFNYEAPSSTTVVSDGRSVVVENVKLKTADLYPLSKTPLKLLLDDNIDLSGNKVKSVKEEDDFQRQAGREAGSGPVQDQHPAPAGIQQGRWQPLTRRTAL